MLAHLAQDALARDTGFHKSPAGGPRTLRCLSPVQGERSRSVLDGGVYGGVGVRRLSSQRRAVGFSGPAAAAAWRARSVGGGTQYVQDLARRARRRRAVRWRRRAVAAVTAASLRPKGSSVRPIFARCYSTSISLTRRSAAWPQRVRRWRYRPRASSSAPSRAASAFWRRCSSLDIGRPSWQESSSAGSTAQQAQDNLALASDAPSADRAPEAQASAPSSPTRQRGPWTAWTSCARPRCPQAHQLHHDDQFRSCSFSSVRSPLRQMIVQEETESRLSTERRVVTHRVVLTVLAYQKLVKSMPTV